MQLHLPKGQRPHVTATKSELRRLPVDGVTTSTFMSFSGIDVFAPGECPCAAATKEDDRG